MPKGAGLTKPMKLSAELADVVGKKEASRAECIKQLWAYIKKHNLQDPENKQYFTPDKKMAKVITCLLALLHFAFVIVFKISAVNGTSVRNFTRIVRRNICAAPSPFLRPNKYAKIH